MSKFPSDLNCAPCNLSKCPGFVAVAAIKLFCVVCLLLPGNQTWAQSRNQALYVPMRDGVRLAIDVWLPESAQKGEPVPTLMVSTRYWRAHDYINPANHPGAFALADQINDAGYALVQVDARGSGASFGNRPYELSQAEVQDYGEIVDWIVTQPWSNMRVGAFGTSYKGNTAEMLLVSQREAVKAVAPLFNDFDNFGHLVFPGGVLCHGFLENWGELVSDMDDNNICGVYNLEGEACEEGRQIASGVKPVDADVDRSMLAKAVEEHKVNPDLFKAAMEYEYRDDPFGAFQVRDVGYKRSPCNYLPQIEASGGAMLIHVGWLDAGTVNGALGRYNSIRNPQRVFIGPWDHGGRNDADPFRDSDAQVEFTRQQRTIEMLAFFDEYLKPEGKGQLETGITYYTLGSGTWRTTEVWPPLGLSNREFYFAPTGTLSTTPPSGSDGEDKYIVDHTTTTGLTNRWATNGGAGDVIYPNRAEEDEKLLTYTSAPLDRNVEITGHPIVELHVASSHTDGAFFVYLEDVDPEGRVTYITEGQLRAIMRKVSDEPPLYKKYGPHRSELRGDAMPLVPGEVAVLQIELWATSVLIRKGHSIRISIAGADADSFTRYPRNGGTPTLRVQRTVTSPSKVILPMADAPELAHQ